MVQTKKNTKGPCAADSCEKCDIFLIHISSRDRSRRDYQIDKDVFSKPNDNSTIYMSCDLQKVTFYLDFPVTKRAFLHLV